MVAILDPTFTSFPNHCILITNVLFSSLLLSPCGREDRISTIPVNLFWGHVTTFGSSFAELRLRKINMPKEMGRGLRPGKEGPRSGYGSRGHGGLYWAASELTELEKKRNQKTRRGGFRIDDAPGPGIGIGYGWVWAKDNLYNYVPRPASGTRDT